MMNDPQNKSPRTLQLRDYLWEVFDQLAQEMDCTTDSLVNEALRLYAQSRGRGGPTVDVPEPMEPRSGGGFRGPGAGAPMPGMQRPVGPGMQGMPGMPGAPPPRPLPGMQGGGLPGTGVPPPRPMPGMPGPPPGVPSQPRLPSLGAQPGPVGGPPGRPGGMPGMPQIAGMPQRPPPPTPQMGAPQMGAPQMGAPQMPPRPVMNLPQGLPGAPALRQPMQQPGRSGGTLVAIYEGQQYPVTKEEFVIGRGQKTSDLTIRDSNVSRRHACVVLYNGQYWIVDQNSTNGVEFNGTKVEKKVVEHGDLYRICDHEIQFVYR